MPDENLPPLNSDLPPPGDPTVPGADAPAQTLSLMPDQLQALGLGDCKPGSTYTIQLKAGKMDGPDMGQSFDVLSAEPGAGDDDDNNPSPENEEALPVPDGLPGATPPPDDEDSVLGYKRNIKPPRVGLPSTKLMRE